jgi:hypothetical protein
MSPPNTYMVYVPLQWETVVSQDMKFDEEAWSSLSHEPPREVEGENLLVPSRYADFREIRYRSARFQCNHRASFTTQYKKET